MAPKRTAYTNPLTWWGDTPLGWNAAIPTLTPFLPWHADFNPGELEALNELFWDNMATLLGVTGSAVNHIGWGIISNQDAKVFPNAVATAAAWEKVYFEKAIPGAAMALLFGNIYYAWMCGRLGAKESRTDVTAQPYGMNTTGIYIMLYAITLTALFAGMGKHPNDPSAAADYAWKVSVAANFIHGLFEVFGCFIGDALRYVLYSTGAGAALYVPLLGVGFVWLALSPMVDVAAEGMVCLLPFIMVIAGFFGYTRYRIVGRTTFPVALVAIITSIIIGWAGGCKHEGAGVKAWGYGNGQSDTCTGTDKDAAKAAYEAYAWPSEVFTGFGSGLSGLNESSIWTKALLVAVTGILGTMACVESAELAGDVYPMMETMIVDGVGTMLGALFGGIYSTTVYIGHPAHKQLGARRGYSVVNGVLYFVILTSGLFPAIYSSIPKCGSGAILIFVGLLLGTQAFDEAPVRHYPALFIGVMPFLANYMHLFTISGAQNMGIQQLSPVGGTMQGMVLATLTCYCTDRQFKYAAVLSVLAIFLSLFGLFASYNHKGCDSGEGSCVEDVGFYDKHGLNVGWSWAVSWTLALVYFVIHHGLQQIGYLPPPVPVDAPKDTTAVPPEDKKIPVANTDK